MSKTQKIIFYTFICFQQYGFALKYSYLYYISSTMKMNKSFWLKNLFSNLKQQNRISY